MALWSKELWERWKRQHPEAADRFRSDTIALCATGSGVDTSEIIERLRGSLEIFEPTRSAWTTEEVRVLALLAARDFLQGR